MDLLREETLNRTLHDTENTLTFTQRDTTKSTDINKKRKAKLETTRILYYYFKALVDGRTFVCT